MQNRRWLHLLLTLTIVSVLLLQGQQTGLAATPRQEIALWPERALDDANVINITAAGFDPSTLTVFGPTEVTWVNTTSTTQTLRGGDGTTSGASNVFLPLVQRGSAFAVEAASTYLDYLYQQTATNFTATLAPGQSFTYRFTAPGVYKFYLANTPTVQGALTLSGVTILRTSPSNGEGDVAVTRETIFEFSGALDPATVTPAAFVALAGTKTLDYRLVLSADKQRVTLFYKNSLPGSTRVRVTADGSQLKDAQGNLVDLDGDGVAGGNALLAFDTLSLTVIPGTSVCGRVFASELAMTARNVSVNTPLQGVTVSVDGLEEALRTTTDSAGNFCLNPAPAGRFFVHIDGRAATNPIPVGQYYPVVGKAWQSLPGQRSNVGDVFLPLIPANTLQAVSQAQDTQITFADSVLQTHPDLQGVSIVVPANSLFSDDGERGGKVGIAPVPPDRLPGTLPDGLTFPVVITVQTDGAGNFDTPAPVCFPNLPDQTTGQPLPSGGKSALWSFNHDTGNWEIVGPMTVSADGRMVCTDAGVGIRAPGWHGTQPGTQGEGAPPPAPPPDPQPRCDTPSKWEIAKLTYDIAKEVTSCAQDLAGVKEGVRCITNLVTGSADLLANITQLASDINAKPPKAGITHLKNTLTLLNGAKQRLIALLECTKIQDPLSKAEKIVNCVGNALNIASSVCGTFVKQQPGKPERCQPSATSKLICTGIGAATALQTTVKGYMSIINAQKDKLILTTVCSKFDQLTAIVGQIGGEQLALLEQLTPEQVRQLEAVEITTAYGQAVVSKITTLEQVSEGIGVQQTTGDDLTPEQIAQLTGVLQELSTSLDEVIKAGDVADELLIEFNNLEQDTFKRVNLADQDLTTIGVPMQAKYLYAVEANAIVQRGESSDQGTISVILPPDRPYTLTLYSPANRLFGNVYGLAAGNGQATNLVAPVLEPVTNLPDADNDTLVNGAEFVIGTNPNNPDTDNDGINDGTEVQQGTNPLDGLAVATGIIATTDTPGMAVDICAADDLIAVADADAGVALFNVFNGANPTIVNQVDTPGDAIALACGSGRVAVADGESGLAIIDASNPATARISRQVAVGGTVQAVAVAGNIAYAGTASGEVVALDLVNGTTLDQVTVTGDVHHLAVYGDVLYVLTGDTIHTILLQELPLQISASVPTAASGVNQRLFAAESILYLIHSNGYNTFGLTDPTRPTLIAAGSTGQNGWQQLVTNGSGLGVAVLGANFPDDISLYDVREPSQTDRFLTTLATPGLAAAVMLYNGQAYVADSEAGMQVINYLAADTKGITPTITLSSNFAPGVAEEKAPMRLTATTSDDVQVRNVEFYIDGNRVATDGNFPFELWITTPALATQPSFALRAKATDTGGKSAWAAEQRITLVADATPPRVTTTTPSAGSFAPPNSITSVRVTLNEALNAATVNNTTFQLFNAGADKLVDTEDDQPVAGTVAYDAATKTASFTPGAALSDSRYRAVLAAGITDLAGNPLKGGAYSWRFSVGVVTWDGGGDGTSWHDSQNWEENQTPANGAIVLIDGPVNGAVVYNQGETTLTSLQSSKPLQLTNGKLTINQASTINSPLTMSGGELGGAGNLVVSGVLEWSGGTMSGSGKTVAQGGLTLNGYQVILDGRTFDNVGAATWSYTGYYKYIYLSNNAVFNNLTSASFTDQTTSDGFAHQIYGDGSNTQFNNQGTYTKAGGTDPTTISVAFNNTGIVNASAGPLNVTGGNSSGSFSVAAGAVLAFSGDHTLMAGSVVNGAGEVAFTNGATSILGSYAITGLTRISGGTATFNTGGNLTLPALTMSGGTFISPNNMTVSGVLEWSGGTMSGSGKTVAQGGLTLNGYQVILDGRTFDNVGAATWSYTGYYKYIYLSNNAVFNNLASASFTDQTTSDGFAHQIYGDGSNTQFNNQGTYTKAGGTDSTTISLVFNNTGALNLNTGTLMLAAGNSSGAFKVAAGATLQFSGDNTVNPSAALTGNGQVELTSGTLTFNGNHTLVNLRMSGGTLTGPNTLTISGVLEWSGGTMSGSGKTVAQGGLTLNGYQVVLDGRTFDNVGTATWSYTGYYKYIYLSNNAVFNNLASASFTDQTTSDGFARQIYGDGSNTQFNNQGTYTKVGGTDSTTIYVTFNNTGTLNLNTGMLTLTNGSSRGTMTIGNGNTLDIDGVFENRSGAVINGSGTLDLRNATFTNNGSIAPTVIVIN